MARTDLLVVERADDFEAAEDAELAVVPTARRHRVHVGAHHHRRERRRPRALAEDVPHLVDGDREASLAHARDHPVAAALVVVGERQAGEPAARGLTDPAELLDRALEALPVDIHLLPPDTRAKARDMRA